MNEEQQIQIAFIQYLKASHPNILFTIAPAGVKRGTKLQRIISGQEAKRMGYKKGCPDIMIFHPVGKWHGLFIELKTATGTATPEQKGWITALRERGYCAVVAQGFNCAVLALENYLAGIENKS